jgi:hypothetical protein
MDVVDAILGGDVGKVAGPGDASSPLEFGERFRRIAADMAVGRMVDDEIKLWPILRRLANVGHVGETAQARELLLDRWREQPLVHADILDACLDHLLIAFVGTCSSSMATDSG